MECPNCGREVSATDLVAHDADCDLCESELDLIHCGCFWDDEDNKNQLTQATFVDH